MPRQAELPFASLLDVFSIALMVEHQSAWRFDSIERDVMDISKYVLLVTGPDKRTYIIKTAQSWYDLLMPPSKPS